MRWAPLRASEMSSRRFDDDDVCAMSDGRRSVFDVVSSATGGYLAVDLDGVAGDFHPIPPHSRACFGSTAGSLMSPRVHTYHRSPVRPMQ